MGWFDQNGPTASPDVQPGTYSGGGGGEDPQAVYMELVQGKPLTIELLRSIEPEMQRRTGARLIYNVDGTKADWQLPNGQIYDAVTNFGGPVEQRQPAWQLDQPAGGGMSGYVPGSLGQMAGNPIVPYGSVIQTPTGTDDPGFDFAMQEGQKAIERSAAAKGTLLTGGTLKDLARYSTGMALQGYGDAWNRAFARQNAQFGQLSGLSGMGLGAASGYAGNVTDLMTGAGNARAAGTATQGGIWGSTIPNLANLGASTILYRNQQAPATGPSVGPVTSGVPRGAFGQPIDTSRVGPYPYYPSM